MIKKLNSSQIIMYSFLGIIIIGALLLMLPISTKSNQGTPFLKALFTATSAVCVTGLIVQDTATYFSVFGQLIILILIQIGGMGIITIAITIAILSGKKINLKQRSTMQEAISAHKVGGIVKLTGFIIKTSLFIELIGAMLLFPIFIKEFDILTAIGYSIFHSISAFCNAGFDLMGIKTQFSSLRYFAYQPLLNLVISSLIIIGGLGFMTWEDIATHQLCFRKYRMQSKVIIITSLTLIFLPMIYFFFFEFNQLPLTERFWLSYFQAITPRTAGFNTSDLTTLSDVGILLMIVLMLIGGSPGSTAGGFKTTTFAILLASAYSVFSHQQNTNLFKRRIDDETVKHASAIFILYISLFTISACIIGTIENLPLLICLFETASAIGTVGLSLGITASLSSISHIILIGLMFFGRVGGLTLIFATFNHKKQYLSKFPIEKVTVG